MRVGHRVSCRSSVLLMTWSDGPGRWGRVRVRRASANAFEPRCRPPAFRVLRMAGGQSVEQLIGAQSPDVGTADDVSVAVESDFVSAPARQVLAVCLPVAPDFGAERNRWSRGRGRWGGPRFPLSSDPIVDPLTEWSEPRGHDPNVQRMRPPERVERKASSAAAGRSRRSRRKDAGTHSSNVAGQDVVPRVQLRDARRGAVPSGGG